MPFSIGWSELIVVGVVALVIMGPTDLVKAFRKLGQVTGQLRAMAREFTSAINDAADQAGLSEARDQLQELSNFDVDWDADGIDAFNEAKLKELDGEQAKPQKPKAKPAAKKASSKKAPAKKPTSKKAKS